ncbi:MAG: glycosyltransferase family 9 protein [Chromatiaceae bacterium]|nr:glycosyltransferase family 9 protein [Chromatiaceae bacterium]
MLEFFAYGIFDTLVLAGRRSGLNNGGHAAIVHLELLGDYVLWLPYGRALAQYLQSKGQKVVLVLNATVVPLAEQHFPECKVVEINRRRFVRGWHARYQALRVLRSLCIDVTYLPRHPRDTLVDDATVNALGAAAWGFDATFADRPWIDRWFSRRRYAQLLSAIDGVHQTQRHRTFLRAVGVPASLVAPVSNFSSRLQISCQTPYIVIAPGASEGKRRWPVAQFVAVAGCILDQHQGWRCLIVGIAAGRAMGEQIAAAIGERADNRAGCTDVLGLVGCIAQSRLVLGNDSAAVHIAAACGVPGVAVVGGGHYARCFPYNPREAPVRRLPVTVAQPMDCFGCDWICRYRVAPDRPFPCIEAVTAEAVWTGVETALAEADRSPQR